MKQIKLTINTKSKKYPIIIGNGISNNLSKILVKNSISFNKCLFVVDSKIKKKIILKIVKNFKKKKFFIFSKQMKKIKIKKM
tara:strand:- start:374 stop:619 length:246 start_codon:yes stop_codon:yes gene_type:complete